MNRVIYENGKHNVKYKMYPVGKTEDGEIQNTFPYNTYLKFTLSSYDLKDESAPDRKYFEYKTPFTIIDKKDYGKVEQFEGVGKTYYEGEFTIDVNVPYELHPPFENAQDLRKMDSKILEKKLVAKYNELRKAYQSKNKDVIANLVYEKLKDQMITQYASKQEIQESWDEIQEILIKSDVEILPIQNYKVQILSNGKLAALFADDTDSETRGGTALICNVKSGHGKGKLELKHYLYLPQGSSEFETY